jgi:hypothetical protein
VPAPTIPDLKVIKRKQEAGEEVNAAIKPKETTHPSPTHNPTVELSFPQGWGSICDLSYPPDWGPSIPSSPPFSLPPDLATPNPCVMGVAVSGVAGGGGTRGVVGAVVWEGGRVVEGGRAGPGCW